ncbi:hypothetical protein DESACE_03650 [Desulfurella acetivorans A63]|nr:hypothetical protein DESACE_03650 [Desulfurella acetivorans A63]
MKILIILLSTIAFLSTFMELLLRILFVKL